MNQTAPKGFPWGTVAVVGAGAALVWALTRHQPPVPTLPEEISLEPAPPPIQDNIIHRLPVGEDLIPRYLLPVMDPAPPPIVHTLPLRAGPTKLLSIIRVAADWQFGTNEGVYVDVIVDSSAVETEIYPPGVTASEIVAAHPDTTQVTSRPLLYSNWLPADDLVEEIAANLGLPA